MYSIGKLQFHFNTYAYICFFSYFFRLNLVLKMRSGVQVLSLSGAAEVTTMVGFFLKAWATIHSQGGIPSLSLPLQGTDTERNLITVFI